MTSTIGRAGKQIFAAIDTSKPGGASGAPPTTSPATDGESPPVGGGNMFSPKPPSIQPPAHMLKKYGSTYNGMNKEQGHDRRDRRDSTDSNDLEVALQECASIDKTEESSSLRVVPPRIVDSPTKPLAISPRLDKAMVLNPQSQVIFNEFQAGNTAIQSLLKPANQSKTNRQHSETDESSAEEFLQSLQKTLQNKRSFNKDELLAQLEALKQQNLMLTLHMERKDQETKEKLEQERIERDKTVMTLEQANQSLLQQLLDAKQTAEKKLAQEKLHFEESMKRLEEDKSKLQMQIQEKQQQMQFESQIMRQLREEMQRRISLLENDRQRMMDEMSSLNSNSNVVNGNNDLSKENHTRLLQLKQDIEKMDKEKSSLIFQLEENQYKAEATNKELHEQLIKDRELFQHQLQAMEREKRSLCDRLLAAENVAKIQHQVMNEEMEKQKRRSFKLEKKHSKGNNDNVTNSSSNNMNHNNSNKSLKKTVSFSQHPDLEIGFGVVQTPDDSEDDEDDSSKEQNRKNGTTGDVSKMTLQEKLKFSAEQSKRRVLELTTKLKKKNKDRLKKNVKKMKDSIQSDHHSDHEHSNSSSSNVNSKSGNDGLKRSLPSTKSLFDLVNTNSNHNNSSRSIITRKQSALRNINQSRSSKQTHSSFIEEEEDNYQILGNENMFSALDSITSLLSSPLKNVDSSGSGIKSGKGEKKSSSSNINENSSSPTRKVQHDGTKSIMDVDSDDDESANYNGESNNESSPFPMPELPPPHLSAAKGDIPRLIILNNMDTKLIVDAVDSVNRHPLFYAVAHGHFAAADFILSIVTNDKTLHVNTNNHFKDRIGNTVNPVHAAAMIFETVNAFSNDQRHLDRIQLNDTIDKTIYHVIYSSAIYHTISHMDVYGDTVVHAAAAGGSEKILSLILKTISDFIKTTIHTIYQQFMEKMSAGSESDSAISSSVPLGLKSFLDDETSDGSTNNDKTVMEYENTEKIYTTILTFIVNNQNSLGLTPSHLSTTSEILEVLHNHHANLLSADFQQRSVLFIACAMNKDSCVEYLINSLDNLPEVLMSNCLLVGDDDNENGDDFALTEQYTDNTEKVIMEHIMKRDYRGDTPLHAAACNNAVESLLILLQSGIDPRLMNDKQYTAYDLAVKNHHDKCIQILAEYTLHYCTSSEFDSVLFLKTLEGHKKIQDFIKDNPGYHMRNSTHNKGNKTQQAHNMSMFSLKNAKSMKLQRYGNWIAYYDADNPFAIFWYNHETTQSQWETPLEVMEWQERHHSSSNINIFDQTMKGKMSMRLRREGDWILYTAEEGKTFYYNEKTGDFQWTNPFHNEVEDHLHGYAHHNYQETQNDFYPMVNHHDLPDYVLSSDWRPYLDDNSGLVYWYNHSTKVSQWESPFEHAELSNSEKAANAADHGYFDHLHNYQDQIQHQSTDQNLSAIDRFQQESSNKYGEIQSQIKSSNYSSPRKVAVEGKGVTNSPDRKARQDIKSTNVGITNSKPDNVFCLDEDEDEDDLSAGVGRMTQQESKRRSDMKEKLKQFSFKQRQQSIKRDQNEEEPVIQVDNEHDLDI